MKKTILCIPGLGGYEKVFKGYEEPLSGFDLFHIRLIDLQVAEAEIEKVIREKGSVIMLCNCYGVQSVLRVASRLPSGSIEKLIIIEPFFAEFFWWHSTALFFNTVILKFLQLTDWLGLYRRNFDTSFDYSRLPKKHSLIFQPLFDISHQSLTDYFTKIQDILTFKLPLEVAVPSLFIFSPGGYMKDPKKRKKMLGIFTKADSVEIGKPTHDIVAVSTKEVAQAIGRWLAKDSSTGQNV